LARDRELSFPVERLSLDQALRALSAAAELTVIHLFHIIEFKVARLAVVRWLLVEVGLSLEEDRLIIRVKMDPSLHNELA